MGGTKTLKGLLALCEEPDGGLTHWPSSGNDSPDATGAQRSWEDGGLAGRVDGVR